VYVKNLSVNNFRCFSKATIDLQFPGRSVDPISEVPNINLILGYNGGGKSSVLRALAISTLAPILNQSGFVPYYLVRRPDAKVASLKISVVLDGQEVRASKSRPRGDVEFIARIRRRSFRGGSDVLSTPLWPMSFRHLYDEFSSAHFIVGYGATRRVESGAFSEGSLRKLRGLRYQRVASLFEDHVSLQPLHTWFLRQRPSRREEVKTLFNKVLPMNIRFTGDYDKVDEQVRFDFNGRKIPFSALSDGYKAFIGWVGDLMGHLCEVTSSRSRLDEVDGIALVDEIDLHLHPEWQRLVVPAVARAFPRLQFVFTSHSPIVAGTLHRENIFVTEEAPDRTAVIRQLNEAVHGRSAEQVLLSPYFGMSTTRAEDFEAAADKLFRRAASGDTSAALNYLEKLTGRTLPDRKVTQPRNAVRRVPPDGTRRRRLRQPKRNSRKVGRSTKKK